MKTIKAWLGKTENIFLLIAGTFGLLSLFLNPLLVIPDEGTHLGFSYSMFSCNAHVPEFVRTADHFKAPSDIKKGRYLEDFTKKVDLGDNCYAINFKTKDANMKFGYNQQVTGGVIKHFDNLPGAIGVLLGRVLWPTAGGIILLGRLTNFLLFVIAVYFIIKKVKFGKLVFLFIAITPMMIQQMASLSYDVFNLVAIFTFVAFCINLIGQKTKLSRKQWIHTVGVIFLLFFSKQNNLLMLPLLGILIASKYDIVLVSRLQRSIKATKQKVGARSFRLLVISLAVIVGVVMLFLLREAINVHRLLGTITNTLLNPNVNGQLDSIATTGIVGNFGWLAYHLPEWVVVLWFMVFGVILWAIELPKIGKTISLSAGTTFLLICASIFAALGYNQYLVGSNVLLGIQGRYFTPLFVLLILAAPMLRHVAKLDFDQIKLQSITIIFSVSTLILYLWQTWIYYY